mmetsp:Transcript_48536/g.126836  ORF Transcript_48536/g.126836 Transcript_48536/m.126836 type:complete len:130 (-) Transcript_48536:55-444(-)|eukprot:CAMPEP_0115830334 /NCGR_PEP_ID=MMETSP0287-20121206/1565_1 /TAXON_ID=412157 /ORGANISM="Chrysochromulina rotalis, Strain UIO044" /LENGTH=129 /DNA_ID=CAMNT_0003283637 /DNA_START=333 /DNA_END=722 /DNA_ORIENTATION=+
MYAAQNRAAASAVRDAAADLSGSTAADTSSPSPRAPAAVSQATADELASAVESLRKRRGGAATAEALEQLRRGEYAAVADQALEYYDALYDEYARSSRRKRVLEIKVEEAGQEADAARVLGAVREANAS